MIRRVASPSEKPVWGVTVKGLAALAFEYAATFVAITFAVLAFIRVHDERVHSIQTTCAEANRRHQEAIPKLGGLITHAPPPKTVEEHRQQTVQRRALLLLEGGQPAPRKGEGEPEEAIRYAYVQLSDFIDLLAPRYDCTQRVRQLTRA